MLQTMAASLENVCAGTRDVLWRWPYFSWWINKIKFFFWNQSHYFIVGPRTSIWTNAFVAAPLKTASGLSTALSAETHWSTSTQLRTVTNCNTSLGSLKLKTRGINLAVHNTYHHVWIIVILLLIVWTFTTTHKETWSLASRYTAQTVNPKMHCLSPAWILSH